MTATVSETAAVPAGFDFASPDLMAERIPLAEFALLHRTGAPWWNAQPRGATGFDDDGFWVISRHAHIKEISRDHEQWSSNARGAVIRFNETFSPEELDVQRENLLLHLDPPQHAKLRKIVSRGFTPRVVNFLHDALGSLDDLRPHLRDTKRVHGFHHQRPSDCNMMVTLGTAGRGSSPPTSNFAEDVSERPARST